MSLFFSPVSPSRFSQRIALSIVAAMAAFIAIYMGLYQWGLIDSVWDPIFGKETEKVLDSNASHIMREYILIPDSVLGAISYIGDIFFALAGSSKRWYDRPWLVILFGLYVIPPAAVSIILVMIQATVLKNYCFLCLTSASISMILIALSFNEVWYSLYYLKRVWQESKDIKIVMDTLCGKPSVISYQVAKKMDF